MRGKHKGQQGQGCPGTFLLCVSMSLPAARRGAAVQKWLCEGCSHSQDQLPRALRERASQFVSQACGGSLGPLSSKAICRNITPQQKARFCFRTQRKIVHIIGNFKKSHHISTLSQVRGLQRVQKEAHNFHLGLFRPLKKKQTKIK